MALKYANEVGDRSRRMRGAVAAGAVAGRRPAADQPRPRSQACGSDEVSRRFLTSDVASRYMRTRFRSTTSAISRPRCSTKRLFGSDINHANDPHASWLTEALNADSSRSA